MAKKLNVDTIRTNPRSASLSLDVTPKSVSSKAMDTSQCCHSSLLTINDMAHNSLSGIKPKLEDDDSIEENSLFMQESDVDVRKTVRPHYRANNKKGVR